MDRHHVQQVVSRVIHPELGKLIDSNRRGVSFNSSHHVQQVVSRVIHPKLGKLIDSNRRGVSFISPSASCEKLKKVCVPLLKSLRNGLRCDFGLASAYVIC